MSVTATRKVSSPLSSGPPVRRTGAGLKSFVEQIDTTNNVLVKDEERGEGHDHSPQERFVPEDIEEKNISTSTAYVTNAIEALGDSKIFEEDKKYTPLVGKKVGIYDKNQQDIGSLKTNIKNFFDNISTDEEVDELI